MQTFKRSIYKLSDSLWLVLGLAATLNLGAIPAQAQISFTTSQSLPVFGDDRRPGLVVTGDLDNDGDLDIAAVSRADYYSYGASYTRSYLIVSLNQGDGTFTTEGQNRPLRNLARDLVLGDLDGDGDLDLAISFTYFYGANGIRYRGTVNVLKNRGDGSFGPEQPVFPLQESFVLNLGLGDFDGDQDLDLVIAGNDDFGSRRAELLVLINNGNATFKPGPRTSTGRYPIDIAVGDLDGDGDLDVALANQYSDDVSLFLNDGKATITPGTQFAAGRRPTALTIGDLDGDTDLDLVVINTNSRDLSALENNGAGNFAPPRNTPLGTFPEKVILGDFDQDTDLDVIVTGYGLRILTNRGNGSFLPITTVSAGQSARDLASGDLNGDNKLDLVVANVGFQPNLEILFNTTP